MVSDKRMTCLLTLADLPPGEDIPMPLLGIDLLTV
jgi:hypothetical protein